MHSQLFNGLGFKAERNEEIRQQTKEQRQMIMPHLKIQNQCESKNCEGICACKEPVPEDLIILDQEQEDEDDLDV